MILSRKRGNLASYLLVLAMVCVLSLATEAVSLPADIYLLGLGIIGVSLLPIFAWIRSGASNIPMFELISVSYGLQFGFGVFALPNSLTIQNQLTEIPWDYIRKAQLLALLGISAMVGSFAFTRRSLRQAPIAEMDLPMDGRQRMNLLWFSLLCWAVGSVLQHWGMSWLGGINRLLSSLPLLAFTIITVVLFKAPDRMPIREKVILVALGLWLSYVGFGTAMLETAFIPFIVFMIIRTAKLRRLSIALMATLFVVLSVTNGVKMGVREDKANGASVAGLGTARLWIHELEQADYSRLWHNSQSTDAPAFWRVLMSRFDLLNRFGWVCMNTPSRVPYFLGETYKYFLYAPIPRAFWPSKPLATDAVATLDNAYLLRSLTADSDTYAIGVGYIPEAYANFSWVGVGIVLALQGAVFALFNRMLNSETSEGGAAIFVLVTAVFLNGIGAASIMLFGNILQLVVCCIFLVFLFAGKLKVWGKKRPLSAMPQKGNSSLRGTQALATKLR